MQTKRTNKVKATVDEDIKEMKNPLISLDKYLEAGVHIGSKYKTGDMREFIYKIRPDGLCVLDIGALNERIKIAAKFISRYKPEEVLVVAARAYAQTPAKKFAEIIGAKVILSRFVPGTLTNPFYQKFMESELIVVADPSADRHAVKEAIKAKVPVIAICDAGNTFKNVDLAIPANNKGKKALALVFWLLTRETLKASKIIKTDKEFTLEIEDFEAKITREEPSETEKGKK